MALSKWGRCSACNGSGIVPGPGEYTVEPCGECWGAGLGRTVRLESTTSQPSAELLQPEPTAGETDKAHMGSEPRGSKIGDSRRVRYDVLPWRAIEYLAHIFTYGANKHGDAHGWLVTPDAFRRYSNARDRHEMAVRHSRGASDGSGFSHAGLAAANALILLDLQLREEDTSDKQDPCEYANSPRVD